jgi:hypothetical protein
MGYRRETPSDSVYHSSSSRGLKKNPTTLVSKMILAKDVDSIVRLRKTTWNVEEYSNPSFHEGYKWSQDIETQPKSDHGFTLINNNFFFL